MENQQVSTLIWTWVKIILVILAFALILNYYADSSGVGLLRSANVELQEILAPYKEETEIERLKLEKERLFANRKKAELERKQAENDIALIPSVTRDDRIKGAVWFGIAVMLVLGLPATFVVMIYQKSQELAAVILAWRRHETSEQSRDMIRLLAAEIGYNKALLATYNKLPDTLKPIIEHPALPAKTPDALECLDRGLIAPEKPFFFGTTKNGEYRYEDIVRGKTGIAMVGAQGVGKTNNFINLAAQAEIKGWLVLIVDLHFPDAESLTYKLGELADKPNVKYFSEHEDVLPTMWFLNNLVEGRMKGRLPKDPPIIVEVDELLNLIMLFDEDSERKMILQAFTRLTTEGRKNQIYLIAGSHAWKVSDIGSSTFRNNMLYRMAFRADRDDIRTLTKNKRLVDMCEGLEDGECVYTTPHGKLHHVHQPYWTPDAIKKAAGMVKEVSWPDIAEPNEEQLIEYQRNVVNLSDHRGRLKEEAKTLKHGECGEFAKKHGITPQTVARYRKS